MECNVTTLAPKRITISANGRARAIILKVEWPENVVSMEAHDHCHGWSRRTKKIFFRLLEWLKRTFLG